MKKFLALSTLFISLFGYAQVPDWKISEIKNQNNVTAGYIYHSAAAGNDSGNIVYTDIRLVCSTTASKPVLGIFWHNLNEPIKDMVVSVDKTNMFLAMWSQEKSFIYTDLTQAKGLLDWMINGRVIYFQITTEDKKLQTAFDLTKFKHSIGQFRDLCQIK